MQLLLIRHGEAEAPRRDDVSRALTAHGHEQARQAGAWLLNHGYQLDGLFASPYLRARETAGEISAILDVPVTLADCLTPDRDPRESFAWLDSLDLPDKAVIACVCHMPLAARLAQYLCEGVSGTGEAFRLAEIALIEFETWGAGLGRRTAGFTPHA